MEFCGKFAKNNDGKSIPEMLIHSYDNPASTTLDNSPERQTKMQILPKYIEEDVLKNDKTPSFGAIFEDHATLNTIKLTSADQILSIYGAKNIYLLFIWLSMALVWGLSAMSMMVSAFMMNETCANRSAISEEDCTPSDGSIAKEFNLVGGEVDLTNYTASAFLIGVTLGSLILPTLSDRLGRRPIVLLSMFFLGGFGVAASMAPEIYSLIVLRFLQGCFFTGCGITNWVLAYESIPLKLRSYTALTFGLFWVVGYCIVGPIAYFLQDWRWLMFAVSMPTLLTSLIYYFVIPESFHYIVSRGITLAVVRWMELANYFASWTNGAKAHFNIKELMCSLQHPANGVENTNTRRQNIFKKNVFQYLLTNRTLLVYTLVMVYLWTCDTFVYYGLSLFSTQLAGNKYVNYTLMGFVEIPSYVVSPFFLNRLGRRRFVSLCHFLAAISFFIVIFFDDPTLYLIMWLLGKFAISCAFTSLFVYASELFPTIVRNGCIGICSFVARIGGTFASVVQLMAIISPILPTLFFAVCAATGSALTLILPETIGHELPDSPDEMEISEEKN